MSVSSLLEYKKRLPVVSPGQQTRLLHGRPRGGGSALRNLTQKPPATAGLVGGRSSFPAHHCQWLRPAASAKRLLRLQRVEVREKLLVRHQGVSGGDVHVGLRGHELVRAGGGLRLAVELLEVEAAAVVVLL